MKSYALLSVALLITSGLFSAEGKRPNIFFIFADDWGRYASAYSKIDGPGRPSDIIQTPNFDRIADEGVLFRSAFVSAPSCTPCRSALLSGQHFWRTGRASILRGAIWDGSQPAYPLMLRDAGYHIGETYKVWSPGSPADGPYGAPKHSYEKAGGRFNNFSENVTQLVKAGTPMDEAKQALYKEIEANFDQFIADRPKDTPFCYWFGPTNVHRKWIKGSGKALWNLNPDDLKGKMPAFLPDVPEVREDLADYLGEVLALDHAIGLFTKKLEAMGELDNTLLVISGDHGFPGFLHGKCDLYDTGTGVSLAIRGPGVKGGRVVDDLTSLTDLAPTFLEVAGVKVPEVMTGRSLVKLLASEKAGQVEPERTAIYTGRERHVENARADFMPYPQRAIRTPDHLLIINFKPDRFPMGDHYALNATQELSEEELTENTRATIPDEDSGPTKAWVVMKRNDPQWKAYFDQAYGKRPRVELYDLAKDRDQVRNVADDPNYATIRENLEQRLMDELKRAGDPRLIEDGKFYETAPMSGPIDDAVGRTKPGARKKGGKGKATSKAE